MYVASFLLHSSRAPLGFPPHLPRRPCSPRSLSRSSSPPPPLHPLLLRRRRRRRRRRRMTLDDARCTWSVIGTETGRCDRSYPAHRNTDQARAGAAVSRSAPPAAAAAAGKNSYFSRQHAADTAGREGTVGNGRWALGWAVFGFVRG